MDELPEPPRTRTGAPTRPNLFLRVTVVMAGAVLLWYVLSLANELLFAEPGGGGNLAHWTNALGVSALAVPMVWAARRYLDRRPWGGLRLTGPREAWRPFLVGVLSWLLPAALGLGAALALGASVTPVAPAAEIVFSLLVLTVLVLLYEAVPEELLFRGYLFRNLNTAMAAWLAVVVQAVLFTLWGTGLWVFGNGWEVLAVRLPLFFGMGVVLGCVRLLTGNVWACVGFHLAFQVAAQALLGWDLFEVRGLDTVMGTVFLLPFVLGVTVTMLLVRDTGTWSGKVPDPVRA
ncbi:CAAX amino protease [Nocardiopsis terrae]|uniref:Membrane protease YdiL (CAAX protease family) n=1 Tax=Nocardiopsis terrae TaxID=372655 RepID=A0ABR9HB07_9ACTN|nr:type II CAAX endopeptidase family protein [Nocardiopsis terrae]MBE1456213.1 membrane protease YdiL (CAAX protease family) [Nocardiopsis terrae]GHC78148.1 CAAX amino protease [Nocardiopsis terrae]